MPTYATNVLPRILADFHGHYPDINVTVHDVIAETVVEMVRDQRCELGIALNPGDAPDLDFQPLYEDRFMAILPPGHALLNQKQLRWANLLKYPHISLQHPAGTRTLIARALTRQGLNLVPRFESHQLVSIGRMVKEGLGLSVVPTTSKPQMIEMGLECRAIASPVIVHELGIITLRKQSLSVAARAIEEQLKLHRGQGR